MALTIGDNFSYQGAKPLDGRIKYDTLAEMKAMADSTLYDGCLAYCVATEKTYQWKSTNTVDTDTGKWREFTSGGGTGSGHTITDASGTALTQRDTLQFGGDLEVSDDDENEKTVVVPHELTAAELTEIVTPLPSVPVNMPILFDESGAEYRVGWYRLANGTKKPVYQKVMVITDLPNNSTKTISLDSSFDVQYFIAHAKDSNGAVFLIGHEGDLTMMIVNHIINLKATFNMIEYGYTNISIILQYTKTTDTPT